MRKLTIFAAPALALAGLAATATPVLAQPYPHHHTPARAEAIRNQIDELERRVNRHDNRDRISEREAAGLRRDVRRLKEQFHAYNRNGLSNSEFRTLNRRIDQIRTRLHIEKRDWDNRRW